jgi:hypothetical protein
MRPTPFKGGGGGGAVGEGAVQAQPRSRRGLGEGGPGAATVDRRVRVGGVLRCEHGWGERLTRGASATITGSGLFVFEFKFKTISNQDQIISILTAAKRTFLSSEILKENMVVKVLKKGTSFSIGTSRDSKWISNENLENFLGLKFSRISSWDFNIE